MASFGLMECFPLALAERTKVVASIRLMEHLSGADMAKVVIRIPLNVCLGWKGLK